MRNRLNVFLGLFICITSTTYAAPSHSVPAPDRGIVKGLSEHHKIQPAFYDLEHMPVEHVTENISRRFIMGTQSMITRWDIKAGTHLPLHYHPQEQISRLEKGKVEAYSQGHKYILQPGNVMVFPPYVPHEFIALEDSILIEHFTPVRQDFLKGMIGFPKS